MIPAQQQYIPSHKLRDIIEDNNLLLLIISRFGIPFGFGDMTVAEVCRTNNVDCHTFLSVANLVTKRSYNTKVIVPEQLINYLRRAHTYFLDFELPQIRQKIISSISAQDFSDVDFLIIKYFDDYAAEVRTHMEYENNVVFKYVATLLEGHVDDKFDLSEYSANHSDMAAKLNELKDIIIQHYRRHDNDLLNSALYDIYNCQADLTTHCLVENKLLIPAIARLVQDVKLKRTSLRPHEENDSNITSSSATLSNREKEIVAMVARGKSNKEIADILCISFNTVTTHRRNIASKLHIHSSAGLTIFAIINNIIDIKDVKLCAQ